MSGILTNCLPHFRNSHATACWCFASCVLQRFQRVACWVNSPVLCARPSRLPQVPAVGILPTTTAPIASHEYPSARVSRLWQLLRLLRQSWAVRNRPCARRGKRPSCSHQGQIGEVVSAAIRNYRILAPRLSATLPEMPRQKERKDRRYATT